VLDDEPGDVDLFALEEAEPEIVGLVLGGARLRRQHHAERAA
jgi:hypothetical protein